jgi:cytochrome c-type biogenesis protein CcmH
MIKTRRLTAALLLTGFAAAALLALPAAAQQTDRAKKIGGKLVCGVGTPLCDCKQILTECNHVGCPNSAGMLKTLDQKVAQGDPEESILQAFVLDFGTAVLAEPPKSGFNLIAWFLPGFYLVAGAILVVFVISRWRKRPAVQMAAAGGASGISPELLERARAQAARDTED